MNFRDLCEKLNDRERRWIAGPRMGESCYWENYYYFLKELDSSALHDGQRYTFNVLSRLVILCSHFVVLANAHFVSVSRKVAQCSLEMSHAASSKLLLGENRHKNMKFSLLTVSCRSQY